MSTSTASGFFRFSSLVQIHIAGIHLCYFFRFFSNVFKTDSYMRAMDWHTGNFSHNLQVELNALTSMIGLFRNNVYRGSQSITFVNIGLPGVWNSTVIGSGMKFSSIGPDSQIIFITFFLCVIFLRVTSFPGGISRYWSDFFEVTVAFLKTILTTSNKEFVRNGSMLKLNHHTKDHYR